MFEGLEINITFAMSKLACGRGGIGRHARLRI